MREEKNTQRSTVHVGFDGRVHKVYRGPDARERWETEVRVLKHLEKRGCNFVPRLLWSDAEKLKVITSNCGQRVEKLSEGKLEALFEELESYGVRHDDPFLRNVTYRASDGRFCLIDFELATIIGEGEEESVGEAASAPEIGWTCRTDVGRFRKNNEDAFVALALDSEGVHVLGAQGETDLRDKDLIFAVSDGVGGARSGEFASRTAVQKISRMLPRHFRSFSGELGEHEKGVLGELFVAIHADLVMLSRAYPECEGMGTTLTLGWFTPGRVIVAHVGDSRVYRRRADGDFAQLSDDDSYVGWLRRTGKISEREARDHPRKNVLNKSLGSGHQYVEPQVGSYPCEAGDAYLLCTDGVTDVFWDKTLTERLASGATADEIVSGAVSASGKDNTTAVVVRVR